MVNAWNAKWAGTGIDCIQIVRTYLDTQSSIEQDYLPSFLLGNHPVSLIDRAPILLDWFYNLFLI